MKCPICGWPVESEFRWTCLRCNSSGVGGHITREFGGYPTKEDEAKQRVQRIIDVLEATYCKSQDGELREPAQHLCEWLKEKEATTMQVSYNGFTGELVKLERSFAGKFELPVGLVETAKVKWLYDLSIYDSEKRATHSFSCVKLEDVKFLNAEACFK